MKCSLPGAESKRRAMGLGREPKIRLSRAFGLLIVLSQLLGCESPQAVTEGVPQEPSRVLRPVEVSDEEIVAGQTLYVPVYSHVYHTSEHRTFNMTATLSLRNVSPENGIVLRSVRYYDSEGNPVRSYLDSPHELGPLATLEYVVAEQDELGGAGANFIIEWVATTAVPPLLAEAVMISTSGQQGLSFTSRSVVISER